MTPVIPPTRPIRLTRLISPIILPLLCLIGMASDRITATLTVTNTPAHLDTIQVNSDTAKTWTNSVVTPASQVLIGSGTAASATNLFRHFGSYPPTGTPVISQTATNVLRFIGAPGAALTLTLSGTWCSVTYTTNTVTAAKSVAVPFAAYPLSADRISIANQLAADLEDYATSPFSTGTYLLTNYADLSTAQTITGPKIFADIVTTNLANYGTAISSAGAGTASQQFGAGSAANGDASLAIGTASVGGDNAIGIGINTLASAEDSIAIGRVSAVTADAAVALGTAATASGENSLSLGTGAEVSGDNSIALGASSTVNHTNSIAIGVGATTTADNQIILGGASQALLVSGSAVVTNLTAGNLQNYGTAASSRGSGTLSEQFGASANASGDYALSLGHDSAASGDWAIAMGEDSLAIGDHSIVIGRNATATATNSIAIGLDASVSTANVIAIGSSAHTTSLAGKLTVLDDSTLTELRLPRIDSSTLSNGNNAAVDPGNTSYMRIIVGPTGAFAICGIAGGADGRVLHITNATGQDLTIANDSGVDPTSSNRIYTETGSDWTSTGNCGLTLIYDGGAYRWRLLGKSE